jgi:hypothetical protein
VIGPAVGGHVQVMTAERLAYMTSLADGPANGSAAAHRIWVSALRAAIPELVGAVRNLQRGEGRESAPARGAAVLHTAR